MSKVQAHTHIYLYVLICVYIHTHILTYICIRTCIYIRVYIYVFDVAMSYFEQHPELGRHDTRNNHGNKTHRQSKSHDTGEKVHRPFDHNRELAQYMQEVYEANTDRETGKARNLPKPRITHHMPHNKSDYEEFRHRARTQREPYESMIKHQEEQLEELDDIGISEKDNLMIRRQEEYVGR